MTVDFDTLKDGSITLRERDSTSQVRASTEEIIEATKRLVSGAETWEELSSRLPPLTDSNHDA